MKSDKSINNDLNYGVFTGLLGFGFIILLIHSVYNLLEIPNIWLLFLDFIFLTILVVVFFVYKKHGILNKLVVPILIFILIMLSVFYFFHGGYRGIILFYFIIIAYSYSVLLTDYRRNILLAFHTLLFAGLIVIQFYYPQLVWQTEYSNSDFHYLLGFVLAIAYIIYGGVIVRKDYERSSRVIHQQKMEAIEKSYEIQKKNEELNEKAFQIERINKRLNQMIEDKTARLEKQNYQLIEYAFFNSHKVRGPLARVMGLVELLKNVESNSDRNLYLEKLEESAEELDLDINEINKILIEPVD